ncbi:MAG TPA: hypothetical protein VF682_20005 [Pseudomonas sp.]
MNGLLALHRNTPLLNTVDPRGLSVRSVAYCRTRLADEPQTRVTRSAFDAAGRLMANWGPRLWAVQAPANLSAVYSLDGLVLCSDSVDAGWRLSLPGAGGEMLQGWDGRGTVRRVSYDGLLRPIAMFEDEQCVERLAYGGADAEAHNQCGQLIRHDDPAGTRLNEDFGVSGALLGQTQHVLRDLQQPHWPESIAERDGLLESGPGATTGWAYNPLGELLRQTDALGNAFLAARS